MNFLQIKIINLLSSLSKIFRDKKSVTTISSNNILWNNKEIKEKSVLVWDLENIPFIKLEDIKKIYKN